MNYPQLATIKTCTGCLACVDICHQKALSKYIAKDGHIYVKCEGGKCSLCHKCERVCPVVSKMQYATNKACISKPYSLYCTNKKLYEKSTSGGAFISIALNFVKGGGMVCGAVFCDGYVKHVVSNKIEDIIQMQGSKYIQSDMTGIYREISEYINKGKKVLFTGLGCQAAAIISFFNKKKNNELLYVIDIICGGVPSRLLTSSFLHNEKKYERIIGFRRKNEYVLSCLDKSGNLIYLDNKRPLPLYGFFSDLTKRYSCGNCIFCGIERISDLTIGDYWGDKQQSSIHKSVTIVHTPKGLNMLNASNIDKQQIDWSFLR